MDWLRVILERNAGDILLAVLFLGFLLKFNRLTNVSRSNHDSSTNATNTVSIEGDGHLTAELQNRDWMERHFMREEDLLRGIREDNRVHSLRIEGFLERCVDCQENTARRVGHLEDRTSPPLHDPTH